MSRIEQALEKAALLRTRIVETPAPSPVAERRAPVAENIPPMPDGQVVVTNPLLVTSADPHSPSAEEYRKLKSLLVNLTQRERFDNTLMVTSSIGGEGKTVTAVNLAITLAQELDHTVLLIDADIRKPSVAEYLGLDAKIGLTDCLRKGIDVGDALIRTGIGRLTVLPAGETVSNPAELFSSQKMKDLVLEMKTRYPDRYIIFDAPPVLPFAETRTLATNVDGIIFVVKEGAASQEEVAEGLHSLKGGKLLGMVLNEATGMAAKARSGRYYRYGRYPDLGPRTSDNGPGTADLGPGTEDRGPKFSFLRRVMGKVLRRGGL